MADPTPEEIAAAAKAEADAKAALDAATGDETELTAEEKAALADAGKQAIDRMKVKWQTERDKRVDLEAKLAAATAAKKPAEGDDEAAAARKIAQDARDAEVNSKANERILKAEIRSLATGKLTNPALALKLLDLSKFEVDADGNVDADDINDAIAELVKKEPYLAAQGQAKFGSADGGTRNESKDKQLSGDDVKKMTPEQIVEAQNKGLLVEYLAS